MATKYTSKADLSNQVMLSKLIKTNDRKLKDQLTKKNRETVPGRKANLTANIQGNAFTSISSIEANEEINARNKGGMKKSPKSTEGLFTLHGTYLKASPLNTRSTTNIKMNHARLPAGVIAHQSSGQKIPTIT